MANFDGTPLVGELSNIPASPTIKTQQAHYYRVDSGSISAGQFIHTDSVYNALMNAASAMEVEKRALLFVEVPVRHIAVYYAASEREKAVRIVPRVIRVKRRTGRHECNRDYG